MSQLDISIFYSHLFGLLLTIYIFAHFVVIVLTTYYYNNKLRNYSDDSISLDTTETNKLNTLMKILE
uniref:ATP synthase F0 subunit 8 n=1 Tax=Mitrocomella polydiademata TaxID=645398 RepID=A0A140D2J9_9CNID|nr:ATP synthase F0 subunit 8 [Mitrocomella polydiademata]